MSIHLSAVNTMYTFIIKEYLKKITIDQKHGLSIAFKLHSFEF